MRYTTYINNSRCLEWGINAAQGALVDLFNQLSSWAEPNIIDGRTFYRISRRKIIEELPLWFKTPDNVYRNVRHLEELGILEYVKVERKDMIRLSDKGFEWNSEKIPSKTEELGKISEKEGINSEKNPSIYNTTDINNTTKKKSKEKIILYLETNLSNAAKKFIPLFSDFYKAELVKAIEDKNDLYELIPRILYGDNTFGVPFSRVLKMEQQMTYKSFLTLEKQKAVNRFSYSDFFQRMENNKNLLKNNVSLPRTLGNWARP